jgi:hypothetical protein
MTGGDKNDGPYCWRDVSVRYETNAELTATSEISPLSGKYICSTGASCSCKMVPAMSESFSQVSVQQGKIR